MTALSTTRRRTQHPRSFCLKRTPRSLPHNCQASPLTSSSRLLKQRGIRALSGQRTAGALRSIQTNLSSAAADSRVE
jgi:hypothetical protein